jgi:hypothetical protein
MTDRILSSPPLFTLGHAVPSEIPLAKVFPNWPPEQAALLSAAQTARTELIQVIKEESVTQRVRLGAVNKYLAYALGIEDLKSKTPTIIVDQSQRFHWAQSPIVTSKYHDRFFDGRYFSLEVLHVIWLRAVILLNLAFAHYNANDLQDAIAVYREAAGIFHFLATDRLRVIGAEQVPVEFQAPVFNSLMTLCLAQAYSLIASKGEQDGTSPSAIGKLSYSISATFASALDAIKAESVKGIIDPQYDAWLLGIKLFHHAVAAIGLARTAKAADEYGKSVGLLRLAIEDLTKIAPLHKCNRQLNDAAAKLLETVKPWEADWAKQNAMIAMEPVPSLADAELIVASCTVMPNLPQPTAYVLPQPATA